MKREPGSETYSLAEAAQLLGVSCGQLYQLRHEGWIDFPVYRNGRPFLMNLELECARHYFARHPQLKKSKKPQ
jgi:hypothetical protein